MMEKHVENRPWGKFEQFCKNSVSTVKLITVNPNSKLSLQFHNNREEFWRVIAGSGEVVIDGKTLNAKDGDEFFVPKKSVHRMQTNGSIMKILEISFGEFDEDDIVRIEDDYGRK